MQISRGRKPKAMNTYSDPQLKSRGIIMENEMFEKIQLLSMLESKKRGVYISASALVRELIANQLNMKAFKIQEIDNITKNGY